MKKPILITDLLAGYSAEFAEALERGCVKIARHVWGRKRQTIKKWIGNDREKFELWQGRQKAGEFDNCKYVVSSIGLKPGTRAQFVGVYHNTSGDNPRWFMDVVKNGGLPVELHDITPRDLGQESSVFYDLKRVKGFTNLEGRVIIKWESPGKNASTQAWVQCAYNNRKKVDEVLCKDLASTINFIKFPA